MEKKRKHKRCVKKCQGKNGIISPSLWFTYKVGGEEMLDKVIERSEVNNNKQK